MGPAPGWQVVDASVSGLLDAGRAGQTLGPLASRSSQGGATPPFEERIPIPIEEAIR